MKSLSLLSVVCVLVWVTCAVGQEACGAGGLCRHGLCVESQCQCDTNWAGDDCSIYNKILNSGEVVVDSVEAKQWKFYSHEVRAAGATLTWWLNETDNNGADPDLYLQLDDYPTKQSYLLRNLTRQTNSVLVIENAALGTYYAGVFGFSEANYNIDVIESRSCPDNCNYHGTCEEGQCACYPTYGGDLCEITYEHLTPATPQLGQVALHEWKYYYTQVPMVHSDVLYTLTELDQDADCDLYVAYKRTPSLYVFDYANLTLYDESQIHIPNSDSGIYVLGIYGYTECSFRVTVAVTNNDAECPNKCSGHGNCMVDECSCSPGFDGDSCEWMRAPLALNQPQTGYVGDNEWNYYTARIITNSPFIVNLTQTDGGDCDLYLKADEAPSRFNFDYFDLSREQELSLLVAEPGDKLWYIGVFGWEACSYSLVIDEERVCECGDSHHGHCIEGSVECVCDDGYTGPSCNHKVKDLTIGSKKKNNITMGDWVYYKVHVDGSSAGVVSMKEKDSQGFLDLYVSFVEPPTISSYDLMASQTDSDVHEIQIFVNQPQTRLMYIGVHGNGYITHPDVNYYFYIYAWASPF